MTGEKVKQVLAFYRIHLVLKLTPMNGPVEAVRASSDSLHLTPLDRVKHLHWMIDEAEKLVDENRIEKAMRWLGFIQGVLWSMSFFSVDQLKVHNMPNELAAEEAGKFLDVLNESRKL